MWFQKTIKLSPKSRGCYLITDEVIDKLPELKSVKIGLLHVFIKHTSAAISLNENWDQDVRHDLTAILNKLVPDDPHATLYAHSAAGEGKDDMAGHAKSSIVGTSLTIPISDGALQVGTWQGLYLLEFRDYQHSRSLVLTINGE